MCWDRTAIPVGSNIAGILCSASALEVPGQHHVWLMNTALQWASNWQWVIEHTPAGTTEDGMLIQGTMNHATHLAHLSQI